jgi:hypothetical protein
MTINVTGSVTLFSVSYYPDDLEFTLVVKDRDTLARRAGSRSKLEAFE